MLITLKFGLEFESNEDIKILLSLMRIYSSVERFAFNRDFSPLKPLLVSGEVGNERKEPRPFYALGIGFNQIELVELCNKV